MFCTCIFQVDVFNDFKLYWPKAWSAYTICCRPSICKLQNSLLKNQQCDFYEASLLCSILPLTSLKFVQFGSLRSLTGSLGQLMYKPSKNFFSRTNSEFWLNFMCGILALTFLKFFQIQSFSSLTRPTYVEIFKRLLKNQQWEFDDVLYSVIWHCTLVKFVKIRLFESFSTYMYN